MIGDAAQTRIKYPRWLIVLTAALALMQLGATVQALRIPAELAARIHLPTPLEVAGGLFWAGFAALTVYALLIRKSYARKQAAWLWVGFLTYTALRWVLFVRADYDSQRLPLLLILTMLILIIPCTYLLRSKSPMMEKVNDTKS